MTSAAAKTELNDMKKILTYQDSTLSQFAVAQFPTECEQVPRLPFGFQVINVKS